MLVLTRRLMEKFYIGDDVCVTVVRVAGGQVRLGIDAPRSVPVIRGELRPKRVDAREATPAPTLTAPRSAPRGTDTPRPGPSR